MKPITSRAGIIIISSIKRVGISQNQRNEDFQILLRKSVCATQFHGKVLRTIQDNLLIQRSQVDRSKRVSANGKFRPIKSYLKTGKNKTSKISEREKSQPEIGTCKNLKLSANVLRLCAARKAECKFKEGSQTSNHSRVFIDFKSRVAQNRC
jgi:hypothetical protein